MKTLPASRPISIVPIVGEPSRFLVGADQPYLVDLDENDGRHWCGCPSHEFRIQPLIEKGEPTEPCKHVRAVLDWIERN